MLTAGWLIVVLALSAAGAEHAPLEEIRRLLREQALVAPDEALLSALDGANLRQGLRAIDPWAEWWKPDRTVASVAGGAGIGAEIYAEEGRLWLMPNAGGPLMRGGIIERVELRAVDGITVAGRTVGEVAERLAGEVGETKRIEICATGCAAPRTLTLDLERVQPLSVELLDVAGSEVIRIRHFVGWETRSFLESLLQRSADPGPLLLDLRDCQGGDLFEAMDAAARFLPAGAELASLGDRNGESEVYRAPVGWKSNTPLKIFISRHTASAGEIFAGILQAHGVARLVGERSRGKCVSQTERTLSDGSVLRFTNRAVSLPGGRGCNGVGLVPDRLVERGGVDNLSELLQAYGQRSVGAVAPVALPWRITRPAP